MPAQSISLNGHFKVPAPYNEPARGFAPGSPEAASVTAKIGELTSTVRDLPHVINGERIYTEQTTDAVAPHDHSLILGRISVASDEITQKAIDSALAAQDSWSRTPWYERAAIFLRAAELAAGKYRDELVAATMLNQSKTFHQAEIDAACEIPDFLRYNTHNAQEIFDDQPGALPAEANYNDQRPLEGFVLAVTPFNFTAIASNLPATPALLGNVVVWKPAENSAYSSDVVMRLFEEAGLPKGVINLVHGSGAQVTDYAMQHRDFAGLSFTGSSAVFRDIFKKAGDNIHKYRAFPRLVGETGGKNAVIAHPTADVDAVRVGLIRGAYEFQGQKCSAASRAYIARSVWEQIKDELVETVRSLPVGDIAKHETYVGAVIDEKAFNRLSNAIDRAKSLDSHELLAGGEVDGSKGWFVRPTLFQTTDPKAFTFEEEFFGPFLTVYVYEDDQFSEILDLVDTTSEYALTQSIFSRDQSAISEALDRLRNSAGMTYINDKPSGALMGQIAFGGGRGSGTNDKTGSKLALQRWLSGRYVHENYKPVHEWRYEYQGEPVEELVAAAAN